MSITEHLVIFFTQVISQAGYLGVFVLMTLESMVAPVPSEAVMPFAGFLWYQGEFGFWWIAFASTLGSIVGSLISYYIGAYGGRPIIKRYGKYLMLNEHHLEMTERFFARYGDKTIFISRFIPVIRHLISIPAGLGRMPLVKFCIYTIIGAFLWNMFLAYLGYHLAENWEVIGKYMHIVDKVVVALIILAIGYLIWQNRRKKIRVTSDQ
jgi:membrane protein DedA with SNARE-associated domain